MNDHSLVVRSTLRALFLSMCLAPGLRAQFTWEVRTVTGVGVFVDEGTNATVQLLPANTLISGRNEQRATVADGSWMGAVVSGGTSWWGSFHAQILLVANPRRTSLVMGTTATSTGSQGPIRIRLQVSGPAGRRGLLVVSCNGTSRSPQGRVVMTALGHRFESPLVPPLAQGSTSYNDGATYSVQIPSSGVLQAELEADARVTYPGFSSAIAVGFYPGPGCFADYYGYSWSWSPGSPHSELSGYSNPVGGQYQIRLQHDWLPNALGVLVIGVDTTRVPVFNAINPLLVVPLVVVPFVAPSSGRTMWNFNVPQAGGFEARTQVVSFSTPENLSNGLHMLCIQ